MDTSEPASESSVSTPVEADTSEKVVVDKKKAHINILFIGHVGKFIPVCLLFKYLHVLNDTLMQYHKKHDCILYK